MTDSVAQDMIKSYVERILRMKEEAKAINADIREIYAEAKGNGFDKTVLGKLVNYVEKRAADANAVMEGEALFDLYLTAYYGAGTNVATHTHEVVPAHDVDTGEITEPQTATIAAAQAGTISNQGDAQSPPGEFGSAAAAPASVESAAPIQPETEAPYVPQPVPSIILPAIPADFKSDQPPEVVQARQRRTLKFRPGCKKSWSCGRSGDQSECAQCLKAAQEEGQAA